MPQWSSSIELGQAPAAARRVFQDLCLLLDELDPRNLHPSRQTASTDRDQIGVHLVHRQDPVADLRLAIGDGTTHFCGIFGHDEAYSPAAGEDWHRETLEVTRTILTSRYTVETQLWRGRPYRTLVEASGAHGVSSVKFDSVRGLMPRPREAVQSSYREFDYDCRGLPGEGISAPS